MDITPNKGFDAGQAITCSTFSERVQVSDDQHKLNIVGKERTSALPWRGQFSPQLIEYLLAKHCKKGDYILDPFCGSGTVLREAARANINALGMDVNPAAICLARVSELAGAETSLHFSLIDKIRSFCQELQLLSTLNEGIIETQAAADALSKFHPDERERIALEGALLFLFANGKSVDGKKISKGIERYLTAIFDIRNSQSQLMAKVGDARSIKELDNTFDYLITSPPYINVFNYHQNYRPIIEALGHKPLSAAKSEIGANRKFRQNRYMTVVQYCMDMAQFLVEANRVLKNSARMTIILGRESNVRSVAFKNGELISAIAFEGIGCELVEWNERNFMNRYGESIYEEVITIVTKSCSLEKAVNVGRAVGIQALRNALEYCPKERTTEIEEAILAAAKIDPSPLVGNVVND